MIIKVDIQNQSFVDKLLDTAKEEKVSICEILYINKEPYLFYVTNVSKEDDLEYLKASLGMSDDEARSLLDIA